MTKKFYFLFAAMCCIFSFLMPQKNMALTIKTVCYNGVYYCNYNGYKFVTYQFLLDDKKDNNYYLLSGDVYIASYVPDIGEITSISGEAFQNKKNGGMINVILPASIEKIDNYAFSDATKLYSIQLNEGLTYLGAGAFLKCTQLTSVYIPYTLQEIRNYTFRGCVSLPAIAVSPGVEFIGDGAFDGCTALQSFKSQGGMNKVKTIGKEAFNGCTSLSDVHFSNGLTSIGDYAFAKCKALEKLALPAKLTSIGEFAFANSGLKTLTVSWTTPLAIQANVFDGVKLSDCTLIVPKGCKGAYQTAEVWKKFGQIMEEGEEYVTIGTQKIGGLYYSLHDDFTATVLRHDDNKDLTGAINIPASVTYDKYTYTVNELEKMAFYECNKITSVTLPNTISEIPSQTFRLCTSLTTVTLPSALTVIGSSAFNSCKALPNITLPASLTEIGGLAFYNCESLTSISIPSGVKIIKENCFHYCSDLTSVNLPEGLTEIEESAFVACSSLKTFTLPSSVQSIGENCFALSYNLASLRTLSPTPPANVPDNMLSAVTYTNCILYVPAGTKSKYEAAEGWKKFTDIREVGETTKIKYGDLYYDLQEDFTAYVTYEKDGASNYSSLSGEITVEEEVWYLGAGYKVTTIEPYAFQNCTGITKVNLPPSMDVIYGAAFKNCTNLEKINIPSTLTHLDHYAFNGTKLFNDNIDADGAVYYDGCLIYYPLNSKEDVIYEVKPGTRLLASYVFSSDLKLKGLILPEGLQCICDWALHYMWYTETLSLPSTLYHVEKGFCENFHSIKTIYNYNPDPLDLSDVDKCFEGIDKSLCTLYVPYGSRTAYESADKWKDFVIVEMGPIYTVTFKDYNDNELKVEKVEEGGTAKAPEDPTRDGYMFIGWDMVFDDVHEDLIVTAQYMRDEFTVLFIDGETGDEIDNQTVKYGQSATEPEEIPNHEEVGRVFDKWDVEFDVIKEDLTVTALYKYKTFTVTFLGYEDVVIDEQIVEWNQSAKAPVAPEVEGHIFVGWDAGYKNVKSDLTIHAIYEKETYYVTFYDRKGGIIDEQVVEWGDAASEPVPPTYIGYTFVGWDVEFDHVTKDLEVHAIYELKKYNVVIISTDGSVTVEPEETDLMYVEHGTTLKLTAVPNKGYEFVKWTAGDYELKMNTFNLTVTSDTTVTANFQIQTFEVTFLDKDGEQIGETQIIEWNQSADEPEAPEVEGYNFIGWDKEFDHVQENLTVQAQYQIKTFTVKFQDSFGNTIETQVVEWNQSATAPEAPEKEGYHFIGWSMDYTHVKEDMSVYAKYEINTYKVTIIAEHGTVTVLPKDIDLDKVEHGEVLYLEAEPDEGYEFVGWTNYDGTLLTVTSDTTVTASFKIQTFTVTFLGFDDVALGQQTVEWNQAAVAPEAPEVDGYEFTGWDKAFDKVTEDLTVKALYEKVVDYTPQNLSVVLEGKDDDVQITLSWDKVAGVVSYDLKMSIGEEELFSQNTMTLNVISRMLSDLEKEYKLTPGTYTVDWFVRSTDAFGNPLSGWATGKAFEITVKAPGPGTGIEDVQRDDVPCTKVLRNGVIYIERNGQIYDLNGQMINGK